MRRIIWHSRFFHRRAIPSGGTLPVLLRLWEEKQDLGSTIGFLTKQAPEPGFWNSFSGWFFQTENSTWTQELNQGFVSHQLCSETSITVGFVVRRVREDNVKHFGTGSVPEEIEDVLLSNSSVQFGFGKIALDDRRGLSFCLNENNRRGATAESFNPEGPAARKKIEHSRVGNCVAKAGKDRSFDTVHRWAHTLLWNC